MSRHGVDKKCSKVQPFYLYSSNCSALLIIYTDVFPFLHSLLTNTDPFRVHVPAILFFFFSSLAIRAIYAFLDVRCSLMNTMGLFSALLFAVFLSLNEFLISLSFVLRLTSRITIGGICFGSLAFNGWIAEISSGFSSMSFSLRKFSTWDSIDSISSGRAFSPD